ncbi:hypothetical protein PRIPAC_72017 [Pristionchus pacificus]|nr:hypothetical protein PRIPAC_72017 [Pristionchus pacificus]
MSTEDVPMLVDEEKKDDVRGMNKSGRWWKETRTAKTSAIKKGKPLKTSWQKKVDEKAKKDNVKKLQQQIRDTIATEKAEKVERRKEQEKRRLENERKSEVVQIITKTQKLKKTKKKDLRRIEKRDTNPAPV